MSILVVDDDANCLASLEAFLSSDGHEAYTARRGREAVDFARRWRRENRRLDLSIIDYRMPDLSGIETFEALVRELPGTGAIFVSGDPCAGLEERVLCVGGFAFMPKPLQLRRLRIVLKQFQRESLKGE